MLIPQGSATLSATADFSHSGFLISLVGHGQCHWTEASRTIDTADRSSNARIDHFRGKKEYVNLTLAVGVAEESALTAGQQVRYQFAFQLPDDLPPTSKIHFESDNDIVYMLSVVAALTKSYKNITNPVTQRFTILSNAVVPADMMAPMVDTPRESLSKKFLCCPCGQYATLRWTIERNRSAVAPNEEIRLLISWASEWQQLESRMLDISAVLMTTVTQKATTRSKSTSSILSTATIARHEGGSAQAAVIVPSECCPTFTGNGSDPLTWHYCVLITMKVVMESYTPECCVVSTFKHEVPVAVVSEHSMQLYNSVAPATVVMDRVAQAIPLPLNTSIAGDVVTTEAYYSCSSGEYAPVPTSSIFSEGVELVVPFVTTS